MVYYLDPNSARSREIELLSTGTGDNAQEDLSEFYSRLTKIKDHHRKYPDAEVDPFASELSGILGENVIVGDDFEEEDRESPSLLVDFAY